MEKYSSWQLRRGPLRRILLFYLKFQAQYMWCFFLKINASRRLITLIIMYT